MSTVRYQLKTFGHATMVVMQDGQPLVATDPWLIGSTYWRSWWLEAYPTKEQIELVRTARAIYITHSHPDHFHFPSLRKLGNVRTLHPDLPKYEVPVFLRKHNFPVTMLEPWKWYSLSESVRMASVPSPINDSFFLVDTPNTTIVNINDCAHSTSLLKCIRERMLTSGKPVVVLRSYSPASLNNSIVRGDSRASLKTKHDYVVTARDAATALGASHFVPFASQVFFGRSDSVWANQYKVTYEDLRSEWGNGTVALCEPFVNMDLQTRSYVSEYRGFRPELNDTQTTMVREREAAEAAFSVPADFDTKLSRYLNEVPLLRTLYRKGVGWRLTPGGEERFYDTKSGTVSHKIPQNHDFVVNLPGKVLSDALDNNVLTDLGITMFLKIEARIDARRIYGAFLLMGLHDIGYRGNARDLATLIRFYGPYFVPSLMRGKRRRPQDQVGIFEQGAVQSYAMSSSDRPLAGKAVKGI